MWIEREKTGSKRRQPSLESETRTRVDFSDSNCPVEINWSFISFILSLLWGRDEQPALTINRITFKQWASKQTKHNHWLFLLDFFFSLSCFCFWRVNFSEKILFIYQDWLLSASADSCYCFNQSINQCDHNTVLFLEMTLQGSRITVDYETSQLPSEVQWNHEATSLHAHAKKESEENRQQLWVQLHKKTLAWLQFYSNFYWLAFEYSYTLKCIAVLHRVVTLHQ